ncbi:hypothetical protein Cni_G22888 [Canna indica]|uniref:Uncharacterized protein n=1 Tax=Canna indica TaxID=4628 RepID=A0AAQ3KW03_9LILI|nr:hypothetical protein Cni_G22888 [Canna indica]
MELPCPVLVPSPVCGPWISVDRRRSSRRSISAIHGGRAAAHGGGRGFARGSAPGPGRGWSGARGTPATSSDDVGLEEREVTLGSTTWCALHSDPLDGLMASDPNPSLDSVSPPDVGLSSDLASVEIPVLRLCINSIFVWGDSSDGSSQALRAEGPPSSSSSVVSNGRLASPKALTRAKGKAVAPSPRVSSTSSSAFSPSPVLESLLASDLTFTFSASSSAKMVARQSFKSFWKHRKPLKLPKPMFHGLPALGSVHSKRARPSEDENLMDSSPFTPNQPVEEPPAPVAVVSK